MPVEAKPLFRPEVLRLHLRSFELPDDIGDRKAKLAKWAAMIETGEIERHKETQILGEFLTDIFSGVLGYTGPTAAGRYTIKREENIKVDGKVADAVLGEFEGVNRRYVAVLEGKGPKDPLARAFAGRKKSAVEQAYQYAINLLCDWIIVTSMKETRLYYKGADQQTFERFETAKLATDDRALARFVFLLGAERMVPAAGECHLRALYHESENVGRKLTKEYYVEYANMRQDVFERLCADNPAITDRHAVLAATQKLLDRVLFVAFCEDRGLLPRDTLAQAYTHEDPYNPRPIWHNFRGLFHAIDRGNSALKIPAYNGGLFAEDKLLDGMNVANEICEYFRRLGEYDYRSAFEATDDPREDVEAQEGQLIDVDILGHIFEQSITDLEKLRNELDGLVPAAGKEKHRTRRKKEGAFYTPAFITRYIVQQTLGPVLAERFEKFRQREQENAKGTAVAALNAPDTYDLASLNKPQRDALTAFWERWIEELESIKILDPACGSGAFLIEAFDQLHAQYDAAIERLGELRGTGKRGLFDPDRTILEKNLFGVDLNDEAIQICRLSLWIKTAKAGKVLTSLDNTIRVGNSVVNDSAVHPRAFDWREAFPGVFEAGGFDVVIGNPPYIRQEWIKGFKEHWAAIFRAFSSTADIYTYFFELGANVLRENGRLGFITSGSWVRGNFAEPLRGFLAGQTKIESMIDFGEYQPFEGAEMIRPTITVFRKAAPAGPMRLFKWLTKGNPPENLSDVIGAAGEMRTSHLSNVTWELDPDDVLDLRAKISTQGCQLKKFVAGEVLCGVKTALNEVFVIGTEHREKILAIDPGSAEILKPFLRGQDLREWHQSWGELWLICLKSSGDFEWPWAKSADAETDFQAAYPGVYAYLKPHERELKKRQDQGVHWWELRACAYWDGFEKTKIVWPDISKLPRFSMDAERRYLGNTGYIIPRDDYFLLGVLSSWATWFSISKIAQPLRLRGDRWQYRLIAQFMEQLPIPDASDADRLAIADLAERCNTLGAERFDIQERFRRRLLTSFASGFADAKLNRNAWEWWERSNIMELGAALKTSFKQKANPFSNPRTADEWESYFAEKRAEVHASIAALREAEAEINARVFRLFNLTKAEIELLLREVEH